MIIRIENLRIRTIIGIFEWEKKNLQELVVNVETEIDCPDPAALGDDISGTLDYKKMNKKIINFIEGGNFNLIETVAAGVAGIVFEDDKAVRVTVRVDKPGALRFADSVSVTYKTDKTKGAA